MNEWAEQVKEQAKAALPPVEGEVKVAGLREPVEVIRDPWGVPHVYARNLHDLFFAQGFVIASERLFQLDFMLRLANGRLSELVGEMASSDAERDLAVLRIVHEALHNSLRHASAGQIKVRLGLEAVEISDDGIGFEPDRADLRSRHLGLTSMEERARELGGRLEIRSSPGAGTTVRLDLATIPVATPGA